MDITIQLFQNAFKVSMESISSFPSNLTISHNKSLLTKDTDQQNAGESEKFLVVWKSIFQGIIKLGTGLERSKIAIALIFLKSLESPYLIVYIQFGCMRQAETFLVLTICTICNQVTSS